MNRRYLLLGAIILIVLGVAFFERDRMTPMFGERGDAVTTGQVRDKEGRFPQARELTGIAGYINTEPFLLSDVIGEKVVLIDFWTYSCINCQRTFPYLKAWWDRYEDEGLLIVGVHTPEFDFEREEANVRTAVEQFGITYPVVMDNDYGTWRTYRNQYWPRKYLIDIDGYIVYDHIGEGGYEETEQQIQSALRELKERRGESADGLDEMADINTSEVQTRGEVRSPEVYFGAFRNAETFGNGRGGKEGPVTLTVPEQVQTNYFYLGGSWDVEREYVKNTSSEARLVFRYSAQSVNIVAGSDHPATITILRDGKPIGTAAGRDVVDGSVTVTTETLYNIISDPTGSGEHTLELIIEEPGARLFTFTFG